MCLLHKGPSASSQAVTMLNAQVVVICTGGLQRRSAPTWNWALKLLVSLSSDFAAVFCSPPARWGSLDFIRVASASSFSSGSLGLLPQLRAPDLSGHCPCQREYQNRCQKACQNRWQIECRKECLSKCQRECQNIWTHPIYTSRSYVRNYVRIMCQGGDHSKNVYIFSTPFLSGTAHDFSWSPTNGGLNISTIARSESTILPEITMEVTWLIAGN